MRHETWDMHLTSGGFAADYWNNRNATQTIFTIVFRVDTVTSTVQIQILTGLIFLKLKWYYYSKKIKINRLQSDFWPGQPVMLAGSHQVFSFPIFSSTRLGFRSKSAGFQIDPANQTRFQNSNFDPRTVPSEIKWYYHNKPKKKKRIS
jgi:hypothetical protein